LEFGIVGGLIILSVVLIYVQPLLKLFFEAYTYILGTVTSFINKHRRNQIEKDVALEIIVTSDAKETSTGSSNTCTGLVRRAYRPLPTAPTHEIVSMLEDGSCFHDRHNSSVYPSCKVNDVD
jgi:hypothetical protein